MIYIGTCGYSYKDWEGIFYPHNYKNKLNFYLKFFNFVEIDSTFYSFPQKYFINFLYKIIEQNKEKDAKFVFKLNKFFTHEIFNNLSSFDHYELNNKFDNFCLPLKDIKSYILSILIQFPYSVKFNNNFIENIKILIDGLYKNDFTNLSIEIRNKTFLNDIFINFCKSNDICFVNIDQPLTSNSVELNFINTSQKILYFRLHGRNYENWFKENKESFERYNYLYSPEEIINIGNEILKNCYNFLKDSVNNKEITFIISMNNHYKAKSIINSIQFILFFSKYIKNSNLNTIKFNKLTESHQNDIFSTNILKIYEKDILNFLNILDNEK